MLQRRVERLDALPGQHCAHRFDGSTDRERDSAVPFLAGTIDSMDRCFNVARVLAGFQGKEIGATVDERSSLLFVIVDQFGESRSAGDGKAFGGRSHGTGD